jgi:uncharacterized protein
MIHPRAVLTLYDEPMWQSVAEQRLALQHCRHCGKVRYPPAPVCPDCLSLESEWRPLSGRGTILSWVVFHRQYLEDYKPPYNVIAVRVEEGPILISNLVGKEPEGSWIGRAVELCYEEGAAGALLPRFRLSA